MFRDSFFVSGGGEISDCWRECLLVSRGGLYLLVKAVPKGFLGSLGFLLRDTMFVSAASPSSLIVVSLSPVLIQLSSLGSPYVRT